MPFKRRRNGRKSKYVTKRGLPFQLMKYAETKYNDEVTFNLVLSDTAGPGPQLESIVNIDQNTGKTGRIGEIIQVSGFYGRMVFESNFTAAAQYIRVCVVSPRTPTQVAAPITNMVEPIDPEIWKVWVDKTVLATFAPGGGQGVLTFKKKFKPYLKTVYSTNVGISLQQGQLTFCCLSKNLNGIAASWNIRTYFKDL